MSTAAVNLINVEEASAEGVEGYLRNAQQRLGKAFLSEGGRGTKRTKVAVTSGEHTRLATKPENDSAEQPTTKKPRTEATIDVDVSDDQGDEWERVTLPVKPEVTKKEDEAPAIATNDKSEDQHVVAAQRNSEHNQMFALVVCSIVFRIARCRNIFRESFRPALQRMLLDGDTSVAVELRNAVNQAKAALERSEAASPDLKPAWVSLKKDMLANSTSCAVLALLGAIDRCFQLQPDSSRWHSNAPLVPMEMQKALAALPQGKVTFASPVYFCVVFLCLARHCGLRARLVEAFSAHDPLGATQQTSDRLAENSNKSCYWCEVNGGKDRCGPSLWLWRL